MLDLNLSSIVCNIQKNKSLMPFDIPTIEMSRNREDAWCCGGGGSVNAAHARLAFKVTEKRVQEAQETGASVLATACPTCLQMLELASKRKHSYLQIAEVSKLVLDALSTKNREGKVGN